MNGVLIYLIEIVEKTASYVARNNPAFADRIRENEKTNPKFQFLNPSDAYFTYYEYRLVEARAGRAGTGTGAAPSGSGSVVVAAAAAAAAANAQQQATTGGKKQQLREPDIFEFCASMPPMSSVDLDIVRLTAQFGATHGRQFLLQLSHRENRNSQFDFLRPNHSLHPFFNSLVDQYIKVLRPPADIAAHIDGATSSLATLLTTSQTRSEWARQVAKERQREVEAKEREQIEFAQIDWHDFVPVETIEFTDGDGNIELPPPTNLADLEHATLEQRHIMSVFDDSQTLRITAPVNDTTHREPSPPPSTSSPSRAMRQQQAPLPIKPQPLQQQQQQQLPAAAAAAAAKTKKSAYKGPMSICPRCKQAIPANELQEHMRIELLDPKWKEQKKVTDARSAGTNLAPDEAARNIKRLQESRKEEPNKRGRREGGGWLER